MVCASCEDSLALRSIENLRVPCHLDRFQFGFV